MNNLNNREKLLVNLMEECAELIHISSKMIRCPNSEYKQQLNDEALDVLVIIELLMDWGMIQPYESSGLPMETKRERVLELDKISLPLSHYPKSQYKMYVEKYGTKPPLLDYGVPGTAGETMLQRALQLVIHPETMVGDVPKDRTQMDYIEYASTAWDVDEQQLFDLVQCQKEANNGYRS